jgi:hypothetical protein
MWKVVGRVVAGRCQRVPTAMSSKDSDDDVFNPYNNKQQDAVFTFNLFQQLTSTCFEQAYCSSSGGTTLYIQHLVYVMGLC